MSEPAMEVMTFDHAGISVADLETSKAFYAEVLGFTHVEDEFQLLQFEIRGMVLTNPAGVRIELFERRGSRPNRAGHPAEDTIIQGWFQFALGVKDVHATFERVVKAGAKPLMEPRLAPDGRAIVAFVGDPDNNLVELLQRPVD